MFGVES